MITGFNWKAATRRNTSAILDDEERRILALLAEGKSTPAIAQLLGAHRSSIWFKAKRIRQKLTEDTPAPVKP